MACSIVLSAAGVGLLEKKSSTSLSLSRVENPETRETSLIRANPPSQYLRSNSSQLFLTKSQAKDLPVPEEATETITLMVSCTRMSSVRDLSRVSFKR